MTAGLILAAGESRRMGYPKALLRYREESFADRLVGLLAPLCSPVIVVVGAHAEEIRAGTGRPATFVVNHQWRLGQTGSLQCGLTAVPMAAEGVLFTLVDHPAVDSATIEKLLAASGSEEAGAPPLLRIPRYEGRRGHPIWFSRELIPEFAALRAPLTAKDVVHTYLARTLFLDVDDPGILADIDDPDAYRGLTGAPV